jgi:hypothetical protein
MGIKKIQITITICALLVAVIHLIFPNLKIDAITLILLIIAISPWLAPLFKSLEFPGGWKVEFRDFLKAQDKARRVGLLANVEEIEEAPNYSFQIISEEDPNLAMAGLRIEIEKRLVKLARLDAKEHRKESVGQLLRKLSQQGILSREEGSVLSELIGLLNAAVHGASIDAKIAEWAMEIGPRILQALDEKLSR